jgi:hypothetical protein
MEVTDHKRPRSANAWPPPVAGAAEVGAHLAPGDEFATARLLPWIKGGRAGRHRLQEA